MCSGYSEIPQRLLAYRKALGKTQDEMGDMFHVNQSHYLKLEHGLKIISYQCLKQFEAHGGDVYYLITGMKQGPGILDKYILRCKTRIGKLEALKLMIWLTRQGLLLSGRQDMKAADKVWKYVELAEKEISEESVWKHIREIEGMTQMKMARMLDIDIKRYRRIEKKESLPDIEIIHTLFRELEYSPLVIINRDLFCVDEMNRIWADFPEPVRNELGRILEENLGLVTQYECTFLG